MAIRIGDTTEKTRQGVDSSIELPKGMSKALLGESPYLLTQETNKPIEIFNEQALNKRNVGNTINTIKMS